MCAVFQEFSQATIIKIGITGAVNFHVWVV